MTLKQCRDFSFRKLKELYQDDREAGAILRLWLTERLQMSASDLVLHAETQLTDQQSEKLDLDFHRLMNGEPVQYILGVSEFVGLKLQVNTNVLIPRPETEELVAWVLEENLSKHTHLLLDACTGSGCVALALKSKLLLSQLWAFDKSEKALQVARSNAANLGLNVEFFALDLLKEILPMEDQEFDVIVSNPPYLSATKDRFEIDDSVWDHEPQMAIVVEGDDPIIFYRRLSTMAKKHLSKTGKMYVEIAPQYADAIHEMWTEEGWQFIETRSDINGKQRFMSANSIETD